MRCIKVNSSFIGVIVVFRVQAKTFREEYMKTRILGGDLTVSSIGLGCMGMSDFYGTGDEQEAINVINYALDHGVNFLDTADMYGPFTNEKLVGKAIKDRRHEVILATKFGNERSPDGKFLGVNGKPEYVRKACEDSLKRLGVDHIDLYYQHRVDADTPIEDTIGAMKQLVEEGKVRYLGMSEAASDTIRRANKVHKITALQTEYSLWTRDPEEEILNTIRELGIGFVAYSPLGRGFLTGRWQKPEDIPEGDWRRNQPRFQGDNFYANMELVEKVKELAEEKNVTSGQLALAWVLAQGDDIVPIPGTKHLEYLKENIAALDIDLSDEDLAFLDEAVPHGVTSGDRYPDMSTINR
jgi:aryl-alcohol dehydrogenase-like predicted oxidoreductase